MNTKTNVCAVWECDSISEKRLCRTKPTGCVPFSKFSASLGGSRVLCMMTVLNWVV